MRLFGFRQRKQREQDLERELRAHLEAEADEQKQNGLSAEEAHYAARRAFGNQSLTKENVRAAWGWTVLETLGQDLRYAFRSLRGSPAFALVAIASLGLGIGANTAIFSFVNALLLQKLPVPEPTRLVELTEYRDGKLFNSPFSFPVIDQLDRRNTAFTGVFGRYPLRVNLTPDSAAELLNGELVTGTYFATLQVKPALGRLLNDDDVKAGTGNPVCVISYPLWQGHFGGDMHILGRKLMLSAHPYSVVGVTQKGFFGAQLQSRVDLQIPISRAADFMQGPFATMWKSPGFVWIEAMARLKPGLTMAQAQAMVDPVARAIQLDLADPKDRANVAGRRTAFHLSEGSQGVKNDSPYSKPVTILMGVVGLVLLIACANVANLLLARAGARSKEFAVRLSLGASRLRLMRQLMVESLVLAGAGGLLGVALAFWIVRTLLLYLNGANSGGNGLPVELDPMVIGFSILLTLLTAVLFGFAPAWQSAKPDVSSELKGGNEQVSGVKTRRFLIVLEIALSMVILFAAGLMTRTLGQLRTIDLGFDPSGVTTLHIDPAMSGYSQQQSDRVFDAVLSRLRAQPGIVAASLAVVAPLEGSMMSMSFEVPGRAEKNSDLQTNFNMVSPSYFKTLHQPILAGRDFNDLDAKKAPRVAIVNDLFVDQYMPGENPLGRLFHMGGGDVEIVGLVGSSHYQMLREKVCPLIYLPVKQTQSSGFSVLVRTRLAPAQAVAEIKQAVRAVDPKLPIYGVREFQDVIDEGIGSERMLTFLAALFSALVTLLCGMGVYGLIAYAISRRTREIGVRFAIGAQKADVAKLFLRESGALIAAGVLVGIPLALASARILKSLLYGVEPSDTFTMLSAIAIFLAAGALASLLPVRKATRIEPLRALRYE